MISLRMSNWEGDVHLFQNRSLETKRVTRLVKPVSVSLMKDGSTSIELFRSVGAVIWYAVADTRSTITRESSGSFRSRLKKKSISTSRSRQSNAKDAFLSASLTSVANTRIPFSRMCFAVPMWLTSKYAVSRPVMYSFLASSGYESVIRSGPHVPCLAEGVVWPTASQTERTTATIISARLPKVIHRYTTTLSRFPNSRRTNPANLIEGRRWEPRPDFHCARRLCLDKSEAGTFLYSDGGEPVEKFWTAPSSAILSLDPGSSSQGSGGSSPLIRTKQVVSVALRH
jgi:hypothetical protein